MVNGILVYQMKTQRLFILICYDLIFNIFPPQIMYILYSLYAAVYTCTMIKQIKLNEGKLVILEGYLKDLIQSG